MFAGYKGNKNPVHRTGFFQLYFLKIKYRWIGQELSLGCLEHASRKPPACNLGASGAAKKFRKKILPINETKNNIFLPIVKQQLLILERIEFCKMQ